MVFMAIAPAAPACATLLGISVTGVRSANGWLDVCVFDAAAHFPDCGGDPSVVKRQLPAVAGTARIDVDVVPGRHAVSVLHDENGNGRLDTGFLGIPREGGGVSNNPAARMGPPRFADAVFVVPEGGSHIVIQMVYP